MQWRYNIFIFLPEAQEVREAVHKQRKGSDSHWPHSYIHACVGAIETLGLAGQTGHHSLRDGFNLTWKQASIQFPNSSDVTVSWGGLGSPEGLPHTGRPCLWLPALRPQGPLILGSVLRGGSIAGPDADSCELGWLILGQESCFFAWIPCPQTLV